MLPHLLSRLYVCIAIIMSIVPDTDECQHVYLLHIAHVSHTEVFLQRAKPQVLNEHSRHSGDIGPSELIRSSL